MICRNCLRTAARSQILPSRISQTPRFLSTTSFLRESNPVAASTTPPPPPSAAPPSPQAHPPPEPNSPTTAQALGATLPPQIAQKAKSLGLKGKDGSGKAHLVKSSIPAGTPLKGLNFLKNQQDPVAMADEEYPDWLWTVLEKQEMKGEAAAAGDLFSKSKKQRRVAAKRLRKEQLANPGLLVPKIPIYEQSIDLPAGDGTAEGAIQAAEAREELRKAMRQKRRAGIKENNFLRAMR